MAVVGGIGGVAIVFFQYTVGKIQEILFLIEIQKKIFKKQESKKKKQNKNKAKKI